MKIRKIKVVTIHGQTFTPKQLKEHHKELAKLDRFDIEEYEKCKDLLDIKNELLITKQKVKKKS